MTNFETIKEKWRDILNLMKEEHDIMKVSFSTWLMPLKPYSLMGDELIVLVPEDGYIKILQKNIFYF